MKKAKIYLYGILVFGTACFTVVALKLNWDVPTIATDDQSSYAGELSSLPFPDLPPPTEPIAHIEKIVESSNDLGFKLLRHLADMRKVENWALSPVSLAQTFYLMANGAGGETREELRNALGVSVEWDQLNDANSKWLEAAPQLKGVELSVANSAWIKPKFTIEPGFLALADKYHAEVRPLNLDPASAVNEINDWVSSNTQDMIDRMVHSVPDADFFMANAVYFRGKWAHPFDEEKTRPADFTMSNGTMVSCNMMFQEGIFQYAEVENAQVVRLPYGHWAQASMLVILPKPSSSVEEILESLTADSYLSIRERLVNHDGPKKGTVELPRFNIESRVEFGEIAEVFDLKRDLDLSNISEGLREADDLDIMHKAVVEVDETGAEAAATTAVFGYGMHVPEEVEETFHFRADRPFLFMIEDTNGMALFAGVVNRAGL